MIDFTCTHCNQHLSTEDEHAGISLPCPSCKNVITIPKNKIGDKPPILKLGLPPMPTDNDKPQDNIISEPVEWYYGKGTQRIGPLTEEAIGRLIVEGTLAPSIYVWKKGMPEWEQAVKTELKSFFTKEHLPLSPKAKDDNKIHVVTSLISTRWYYASGSKKIGPIDEKIMSQLVDSGTVTCLTRVWHEGMNEWLPASETELKAFFKNSSLVSSNFQKFKSKSCLLKYAFIAGIFVTAILVCLAIGNSGKPKTASSEYSSSSAAPSSIRNEQLVDISGVYSSCNVNANSYLTILYDKSGEFKIVEDPSGLVYTGKWTFDGKSIRHNVTYSNMPASMSVGCQLNYKVISFKTSKSGVGTMKEIRVSTPTRDLYLIGGTPE